MTQAPTLNRKQRRALSKGNIPGLADEPEDNQGQYFTAALVAAIKGDCKCKTCKIIRKMGDSLTSPYDDDDDDDE
jgi:hypothetical protein